MVSTALQFIGGGLVKGIGEGLVADGAAKRAEMLKRLEHTQNLERDAEASKLLAQREKEKDQRTLERETEAANRLDKRSEAQDTRRTASTANEVFRTDVDEEGNAVGITRGGYKVPLGYKPKDKPIDENRHVQNALKLATDPETKEIDYEQAAVYLERVGRTTAAAAMREAGAGQYDPLAMRKAEERARAEVSQRTGMFRRVDEGEVSRRTLEIYAEMRGRGRPPQSTTGPTPTAPAKPEAAKPAEPTEKKWPTATTAETRGAHRPPKLSSGAIDRTKLRPGIIYQTPNGPLRWSGQNFEDP